MSYALTSKSQVTVPKAIREHLGIKPGEDVDYEPLPDGTVRMIPVPKKPIEGNPLAKWLGSGVLKMPTDEIMRITRGDDWGR